VGHEPGWCFDRGKPLYLLAQAEGSMTYDPSIQSFVLNSDTRWGKPVENRQMLLPYGIKPLDQASWGLAITTGELNIVQGEEKQRKTTTVENVVVNIQMFQMKRSIQRLVVVDMLESGMGPEKYYDTLTANLASRYLIRQGHIPNPAIPCQKCGGKGACKELVISSKFLNFGERSQLQQDAIDWAREQQMFWNLHIYGPKLEEGDTRNLQDSVIGTPEKPSRWVTLIKEAGAKIFVADHLQQYNVSGSAYEKMDAVVMAHSNIVAQHGVVDFLITQLSLTSIREAASGQGKYTAAGGRKASAEGNNIYSTNYVSGSGKVAITVEDSRDFGQFSVWQPIEENSGAFYDNEEDGDYKHLSQYSWAAVTRVNKMEFRPGMNGSRVNGKG
jgi:hypothetical protein